MICSDLVSDIFFESIFDQLIGKMFPGTVRESSVNLLSSSNKTSDRLLIATIRVIKSSSRSQINQFYGFGVLLGRF